MKEIEHLDTDIINEMPREAIRELLELVERAPIEIVSSSQPGLTLQQVLDAFDNEFLLGQILKPQAEVALNGKRAFARMTGDEPERSLAWACAKIFLQAEDCFIKLKIINLLAREQCQQARVA